jgi:osmotically-inducible protein OsmY
MIDGEPDRAYSLPMKNFAKLTKLTFTVFLFLSICACSSFQISPVDVGMSEADYQTAVIVYERLHNDNVTSKYSFHVLAEGGEVTLSGWIDDPQVRSRAISIAQGAQSVQVVVDRMSR